MTVEFVCPLPRAQVVERRWASHYSDPKYDKVHADKPSNKSANQQQAASGSGRHDR